MTDDKRRDDLTVNPHDIAPTYVDSTSNQGSANLDKILGDSSLGSTSAIDLPVFHPGASGARTTPGEGGFAYADTPSTTVFIQKKQWSEQEWTYVTENEKERSGKIQEVYTRIALGNLISRKLDLLNDHESFTKMNSLNNTRSSIAENNAQDLSGVGSKVVNEGLKGDALRDLLSSSLDGSPITRYYTETVELNTSSDSKDVEELQTTSFKAKVASTLELRKIDVRLLIRLTASLNDSNIIGGIVPGSTGISALHSHALNEENRSEEDKEKVKINKNGKFIYPNVMSIPSGLKNDQSTEAKALKEQLDYDAIAGTKNDQWLAINLDSLAASKFASNTGHKGPQSIDSLTKAIAKAKAAGNVTSDGITYGWINAYKPGQDPVPTEFKTSGLYIKATSTEDFDIDYKKNIIVPGKPTVASETFPNQFNGVIELCNITSITASNSNKPMADNASITLENPNNLLKISEDDIEIALGTRTVDDQLRDGNAVNGSNVTVTDSNGRETTLFFHEGRYYTQTAFELVTKQSGGLNKSSFEDEPKELKLLREDKRALESYAGNGIVLYPEVYSLELTYEDAFTTNDGTKLENLPPVSIEITAVYEDFGEVDKKFSTNKDLAKTKIAQIQSRIIAIEKLSVAASTTDKLTAQEKIDLDFRRAQMRKYYQNKTIFEVYDRVYIWMSSPSRTSFRLEDGSVVGEATNLDATVQIKHRMIRNIIGLIKQLNTTITNIFTKMGISVPEQFTAADMISINEWLHQDMALPNTVWSTKSKAVKDAFSSSASFVDQFADFLEDVSTTGKLDETSPLDPIVGSLLAAINQKIDELGEIIASAEGNTKGMLAQNDSLTAFKSTGLEGNDPASLFSSTSLSGIDETQMQVFQGVISNISRSFNNGVYTIQLQCKDNLDFLSRARYIDKPAMNYAAVETRRFLDDPVWRNIRDDKILEDRKDDIAGRWKRGIFSLTAEFATEKKSAQDKEQEAKSKEGNTGKAQLKEEDRDKIVRNSQAFQDPFQGADPATIISLLVTGIPFTAGVYLDATTGPGIIAEATDEATQKKKADEKISNSTLAQIQHQVGDLTTKFGDFEPFLDLASLTEVDDKEVQSLNTKSLTNLGNAIMNFAGIYIHNTERESRGLYQADRDEAAKANQKEAKSPHNVVFFEDSTSENISKVLDTGKLGGEWYKNFPTGLDKLRVNDSVFKDKRIQTLVQCAINNVSTKDLNSVFKNLTTKDSDSAQFKSFLQSEYNGEFHTDTKLNSLVHTIVGPEATRYSQITSIARSLINRGAVYNLLKNDSKEISQQTQGQVSLKERKKIAAMRGYVLDDNGRVTSGNPVSANKVAIAFKQKINYMMVSADYFKSPALVDHVEQLLPNVSSITEDTWKDVLTRCKESAEMIDWEFYADTQGHVRFKPPTYNRTLLKHLLDTEKLDTLYKSPFRKFFSEQNLLEVEEILLLKQYQVAAFSAKYNMANKIRNYIDEVQNIPVDGGVSSFFGLATPVSMLGIVEEEITSDRMRKIRAILKLDPAIPIAGLKFKLKFANGKDDPLTPKARATKVFEEIDIRLKKLSKEDEEDAALDTKDSVQYKAFSKYQNNTQITDVNESLKLHKEYLTKQKSLSEYYDELSSSVIDAIKNNDLTQIELPSGKTINATDPEKIAKEVKTAIEVCISVMLFCDETIGKIKEQLASKTGAVANVLQDLTDEKFIHIIPNAILISEDYKEQSPDRTRYDVMATIPFLGEYGNKAINDQVLWAGAVDYDLWRNYGFMASPAMKVPFIQTNQQARIYALMLMARERFKILSGSITVRGDAKYQPGDTVYIEDEDIYYYVTEVNQVFNYGSAYKTSLTLAYGRRPGEYIPFPFDILGEKLIEASSDLYHSDGENVYDFVEDYDRSEKQKREENK